MPTYIEDFTGLLPANRVQNEIHPVSTIVASSHKTIVPTYAPFFGNGFMMHHVSTGGVITLMVNGVDYVLSMEYNGASNSLGRMVYTGVTILDNRVDGNYRLTSYQTIGGNWIANPSVVLNLLANYLYNPRVVFYEQIVNLPTVFPPDLHANHISDLSRVGNIIEVLNTIASQIADGTNLLNHSTLSMPHMEARLTTEQRNILKIALQDNGYEALAETVKNRLVNADDIVNITSYLILTLGSAISGDMSTHNTSPGAHLDIRNLINNVSNALGVHTSSGSAHSAMFASKANLDSPAFAGTPSAPTPVSGDNSGRLATTAFFNTELQNNANLSMVGYITPNGELPLSDIDTSDSLKTAIHKLDNAIKKIYMHDAIDLANNLSTMDIQGTSSGIYRLPNSRLILQYGRAQFNDVGFAIMGGNPFQFQVPLITTFPNKVLGIYGLGLNHPNILNEGHEFVHAIHSFSVSSFRVSAHRLTGSNTNLSQQAHFNWIAIGY